MNTHIRGILVGFFTALFVAFLTAPGRASPIVTIETVRAMQARIPNCERGCESTGAFATVPGAPKIAEAISATARSPFEAAEMATYAAFESGNQPRLVSKADPRDRGAWQLRFVADDVAFDPRKAAPVWLKIADASREHCKDLPPEERLAELASGSCKYGRAQVRHRHEIIVTVAAGF